MSDPSTLPPAPGAGQGPSAPGPVGSRRRLLLFGVLGVGLLALIVAAAATLAHSEGESAIAASPTGSPSPTGVIRPPARLQANAGTFRVLLSWEIGDGDVDATSYRVYRDGNYVGTVPGSGHRFVDDRVQPESKYRYQIDGMLNGDRSSGATTTVTTDRAPLFAARLTGVYNVRLLRTSVYGVNGIPEKSTQGWRFLPACARGACDVELRDIHWNGLAFTLARAGAAYSGSDAVHGYLECSGTPSTTSYRVTLHVTDARTIRDTWRVSAFEGTVTTYDSPQLGCRSSGITFSIQGTAVR
jgi:hypothetical protein